MLLRPLERLVGHQTPGPGRTASLKTDPRSSAPPGNCKVRQTHQSRRREKTLSIFCSPCSLFPLLSSSSPLLVSLSYQAASLLQAGVDFIATTKADHAMTERALGTSTESITGNKSKGKMLLHSFNKATLPSVTLTVTGFY